MKSIKIINTPRGDAPIHMRQAWIGLVLPLAVAEKRSIVGERVLYGQTVEVEGYSVDCITAITILERSNPMAAQLWKDNAARLLIPGRRFIFAAEVCVEIDSNQY